MQWKGPFTVISKQGACDYIIQMGSKTKVFHINMLKQYLERSNSSSISNNRNHIANTTFVISETEDTTSDSSISLILPSTVGSELIRMLSSILT